MNKKGMVGSILAIVLAVAVFLLVCFFARIGLNLFLTKLFNLNPIPYLYICLGMGILLLILFLIGWGALKSQSEQNINDIDDEKEQDAQ